jgi:hypothetical protein
VIVRTQLRLPPGREGSSVRMNSAGVGGVVVSAVVDDVVTCTLWRTHALGAAGYMRDACVCDLTTIAGARVDRVRRFEQYVDTGRVVCITRRRVLF